MPRAKNADLDITRLCQAIFNARLALRYPRQQRFDAVKQYVGMHWSEEGASKEVYLNLLAAYINIVGRKLIAHNPRVSLSTWRRQAKPVVDAMEDWANIEIEDLNLVNTLQRVVIDALFNVGIVKVALATPADSALAQWNVKAGQPVAERIDLDDFVFDVHARDFSECGFIGHRFRVPLRVVRESKIYGQGRKDLQASADEYFNTEGDERIGNLGRTYLAGNDEEYEDFVTLWEIYLPRHRVVVTLSDEQLAQSMTEQGRRSRSYGQALRTQPWLGPDSGPYHVLGFGVVPGNTLPKAPVQDLIGLHEAVNEILRKLIRQAKAYKKMTGVGGGNTEDAQRLMEGNDGDAIKVNRPDQITQIETGGPAQTLFQLFMALKELFSWLSGNLDIMGGLSPQARTAHQDEMLNQNSTATVGEMQQRTVDFTSSVVKALCWYWHHDPNKIQRSEFSLPGMPTMTMPRAVYPNRPRFTNPRHPKFRKKNLVRSHRFEDLRIKVDPFSMQHTSPQQRLQNLNQIISTIYLPMQQLAAQQGIHLDLNAYFEKIAKFTDEPDLEQLLTMQAPLTADSALGGAAAGPGGPPPGQTAGGQPGPPREYIRRSVGGTPAGRSQDLMQQLAQGMGQGGPPGQPPGQPPGPPGR